MFSRKSLPWIYPWLFIVTLFSSSLIIYGCSKNDSTTTNTMSALSGQLDTVSKNFTPSSLDYTSSTVMSLSSSGNMRAQDSNPCAGYDLFGCQPVLLRIYINMAKMFLDLTKQIVSDTSTHLGPLQDGATGIVNQDDKTIYYKKTSDTNYEILIKSSTASMGHIKVTSTGATVIMDMSQLPDSPGGKFKVEVSYTDENNWSISAMLAGMSCQPDDVRAPRSFWVKMAKANDIWKGKAIIYNPVWASFASEPTCDTTATDSTSMNFYTDFVGDNTAAKASVYMIQRDKTSLSDISTYGMSNLCTNYSINNCGMGASLTAYLNPFCNPAATDVAAWNSSCSGTSTAVSNADFGSASDWIVPYDFYQITITLPDSI
ncbi:MAG: hypothetical protein AABZ06_13070 [Bdellovibrionota bacterium]